MSERNGNGYDMLVHDVTHMRIALSQVTEQLRGLNQRVSELCRQMVDIMTQLASMERK